MVLKENMEGSRDAYCFDNVASVLPPTLALFECVFHSFEGKAQRDTRARVLWQKSEDSAHNSMNFPYSSIIAHGHPSKVSFNRPFSPVPH